MLKVIFSYSISWVVNSVKRSGALQSANVGKRKDVHFGRLTNGADTPLKEVKKW